MKFAYIISLYILSFTLEANDYYIFFLATRNFNLYTLSKLVNGLVLEFDHANYNNCRRKVILVFAKLSPSSNPSWAELVIISAFPGIRPADHPPGKV